MGRNRRNDINIDDPQLRSLIRIFCKAVKNKRIKLGMTQAELAVESKVAVNTVSEIEQERIENLRLSTIVAIARGLKVNPLQLLGKK